MSVRSSQEDFLLRELRKVADAIARALGFRSNNDLPAARTEIDGAYGILLGPQAALMRALDAESVVRLLNDSRRITAMARLVAADALLAGDAGDNAHRDQLLARAHALANSAVGLDPTDKAARAYVEELRAR